MKLTSNSALRAALGGVLVVAVLVGLSSIPYLDFFAFGWLPGALLAALIFPQGIHSDSAVAYIGISALLDILLYSTLSYVLIRFRGHRQT